MTLSPSKSTARVARAGRKLLVRAVAPGMMRWIETAARASSDADTFHALAGSLAAIALAYGNAYRVAGTRVRDLTWALHSVIKNSEETANPIAGLEAFEPWLRARLSKAHPDSEQWRGMIFRWCELASERLTMRSYARGDDRARHAEILIASPLRLLGIEPGREFAELLLRFFDLLAAKDLAEIGYNRVAPHRTEGFGGFYGVVDNIEPLTEGMIAGALAEARAESEKLKSAAPALDSILTELRAALDYRVARAEWPPDFRYVPIEKVLPTRGFLLQLISKLRRE